MRRENFPYRMPSNTEEIKIEIHQRMPQLVSLLRNGIFTVSKYLPNRLLSKKEKQ